MKGHVPPQNSRAHHARLSFSFTDANHTGKLIVELDTKGTITNPITATCFFNFTRASDNQPDNQQWTFFRAIPHGTGRERRVTLVFITGTKPTDIVTQRFVYIKNGRPIPFDLTSGDVTVSVSTDDPVAMAPDDTSIPVDELPADPCD